MKVIESVEAKIAIYTNMFILVNKLHQISIPGKRHNHFKFIYCKYNIQKSINKVINIFI